MVNFAYHTARTQGSIMRYLYKAMLPQIVKLPLSQTKKVPLSVYALSCERDLPEQVASLRSFIRHAGIPDRFIIIYILSVEDQFIYPDKYAGKAIALRHYVSDVRHKFWLNALS